MSINVERNELSKKLLTFFVAVITLSMVNSYADNTGHHDMKDHAMDQQMGHEGKIALDAKGKKEVTFALKQYEGLHAAFFNYAAASVEENAKKLNQALAKISNPEVAKLLTFSRTKLGEIKQGNSREDNDQAYHLVSMALIHVMQKYDVGGDYQAYYCPMVKKKWIQNVALAKEVENPYAPNMPHCGSMTN